MKTSSTFHTDPAVDSLMAETRQRRGYVIILPGIEGYSWLNRRIRAGLVQAEVPYAIEIHDWTRRLPRAIYNLRSRRLHRQQSRIVQNKILAYQQRWPQRPVFLIGHSGGGAMALRILEDLPEKTSISGAVLLGAAISPYFDFRKALQHVDRKIWNMTSLADVIFLGMLTLTAGTLDGYHSVSAGMVGFRPPPLSIHEVDKFEEMPYRTEYWQYGHLAGHFGFTAPRFVKNYIAPLLMQAEARCPETDVNAVSASEALPNPAGS